MRKSNRFLLFSTGALAITLFCLSASQAFAADFRYPSPGNQDYRVQSGDTVKNLYAAANNLTVDANAAKDAVVAGNMVNINGNVADTLLAAGNSVTVRGAVGGTARIAGATVHVEGKIGDDLVVAAANVYISANSSVGADAVIFAGTATIDGPVHGNVRINAGTIEINSKIDGNVEIRAGQHLKLGPGADIKGTINYQSPVVYDRDPAAKVSGNVNYTPITNSNKGFIGILLISWLGKFVAMLLVAWLLFAVFRRKYTQWVYNTNNNFWKNVGIGAILLVLVPIAGALLLLILIGFYAALILFAWYALMLLLSALIGAAALGTWLQSSYNKLPAELGYWNIFLGILIFSILGLIPIIGWIIDLLIALAGFGVLCREINHLRKEQSDGNV